MGCARLCGLLQARSASFDKLLRSPGFRGHVVGWTTTSKLTRLHAQASTSLRQGELSNKHQALVLFHHHHHLARTLPARLRLHHGHQDHLQAHQLLSQVCCASLTVLAFSGIPIHSQNACQMLRSQRELGEPNCMALHPMLQTHC
jgi:hypothetical protein